MPASQARIEANRRNAGLSTGPKTAEGKARSRANGLKHGLCSMTVVAEHRALVEERTAAFVEALRPEDDFRRWAVGQAAVLSLRVERCQRMEGCARDKVAIRAELVWDDDRRLEALRLAQELREDPECVVEQLRRTPQGCDWLIGRWALLAHEVDSGRGWTPDQAGLAFDLLGLPAEFREGDRSPGDPAAVARREIDDLRRRRGLVAGIDEVDRSLAEADLDDETGPELARLRRYESALQSRLRWCLDQARGPSTPEGPPDREPRPAMTAVDARSPEEPAPTPDPAPGPGSPPTPETAPAPGRFAGLDLPFGISPTLDHFVEVPEGPPGRADRHLRKAESRREAKRRKLDRVRS